MPHAATRPHYPIDRAYAAGQVNEIYGGTSEIMKEIISRSL
jgi:alkylation response protein AidB-like acyl-CoA dehydrogenase